MRSRPLNELPIIGGTAAVPGETARGRRLGRNDPLGARSSAASEALFLAAFDSHPDPQVLIRAAGGQILAANKAVLQLYRCARADIIGRTPHDLGWVRDAALLARFLRLVEGGGRMRNVEATVVTGDSTRYLSIAAQLIGHAGEALLLVCGRDITARRSREAAVRRSKESAELANRWKSEFLANMSHELRTPLSAIMGFSEMMRDQMLGPIGTPKYAEYAEDIHRSSEHLKQIINDLLDLSKIEAGKMELRESAVALPDLIADSLRLVRGRATAARVRLRVDSRAGTPELRGDERLLKQILLNLLANAVTFTPQGGRITVGSRLGEAGSVEIYVADSGIGMSDREIQVALTRFGQVDGLLARQHQGTGLGLPLARALAELHGGGLAIRSTPGRGTVVTVTLPADRVLGMRKP